MREDTTIFSELQEFFQQNDAHKAINRISNVMNSLKVRSESGSTNYRCIIDLPTLCLCSFSLEPHTKSNVRCICYQVEERLKRCSTGRLGDLHPLEYTHTGRTTKTRVTAWFGCHPRFLYWYLLLKCAESVVLIYRISADSTRWRVHRVRG